MDKICWGIIGCGDVTEVKSGPAFNKVPDSSLAAVMRRNRDKAKDYAQRHQVPAYYDDAAALIHDPAVNAVYIATPPSTHEQYTLAALAAGKPVYVEKPMAQDHSAAARMVTAAQENNVKLVVAHYRRQQPLFIAIKALLDEKRIGDIRFVNMRFCRKALQPKDLLLPGISWRVNPAVSGGGLFHDLAPHQLDLMYHFFGQAQKVCGFSMNQAAVYDAADVVAGNILFTSGILFTGLWAFNVAEGGEADRCEIVGSKGEISFSVFDHHAIKISVGGVTELLSFEKPAHVQQPMIEKVVGYFLGKGPNPCSGEEGAEIMKWIDTIAGKVV
jgi:predicted dehydrogenase